MCDDCDDETQSYYPRSGPEAALFQDLRDERGIGRVLADRLVDLLVARGWVLPDQAEDGQPIDYELQGLSIGCSELDHSACRLATVAVRVDMHGEHVVTGHLRKVDRRP